MATDPQSRLTRLLGFLEHDPENLSLLADTAAAAFEAGRSEQARSLLTRYAAIAPLTASLENLEGLIALSEGRFDAAAAAFQRLVQANPASAELRVNLAFAKLKLKAFTEVVELLDETVVAAQPHAATLKVQALHQLGELEDALAFGIGYAHLYPSDRDLMSALALVAIDAEEEELARDFAKRAGATHEGLSTLGMLELNEAHTEEALALFDRALDAYGESARALLGKGLVLMSNGELKPAADHIDRAAKAFDTHLGSWVAAGWAHFLEGDRQAARARFEQALALDPTFAETQGGLAVLDIAEGRLESARRRTDVALRLDRNCFSGALAKSLLLESSGEHEAATRIRQIALNTPIGRSGNTIAKAMAELARARPRPSGRR